MIPEKKNGWQNSGVASCDLPLVVQRSRRKSCMCERARVCVCVCISIRCTGRYYVSTTSSRGSMIYGYGLWKRGHVLRARDGSAKQDVHATRTRECKISRYRAVSSWRRAVLWKQGYAVPCRATSIDDDLTNIMHGLHVFREWRKSLFRRKQIYRSAGSSESHSSPFRFNRRENERNSRTDHLRTTLSSMYWYMSKSDWNQFVY